MLCIAMQKYLHKWNFLPISLNVNNFSYFSDTQINTLHSRIYHAEFGKSTKYYMYKNPLQTRKNMGPQSYKEIYARGQCLSPAIHFFVKVRVPYFYEFGTDSNETHRLYLFTKFGTISRVVRFLFFFFFFVWVKKSEKCDIGKKVFCCCCYITVVNIALQRCCGASRLTSGGWWI